MKIMMIILFFAATLYASGNIEIKGKYVKDNENFIYLESEDTQYKLKKSELTEEGVQQILKNKESVLTLFVPPKSVKSKPKK